MIPQDSIKIVAKANELIKHRHESLNVFTNYFNHLAENPERIDSMFQWLLCTMLVWLVIFFLRNHLLSGLAGDGQSGTDSAKFSNLDAREQILFLFYWISPPVIFNVGFFHKVDTWQILTMWAVLAPLFYQIFGRFIFDFLIAWKSGSNKITLTPDDDPKQEVNIQVNQPAK